MAGRALRTDPVEGTALDQLGEEQDVVVDETFLAWNLMWTTQGGYVSLSEIGAAANSLEAGDEAPLLRLAAEHDGRASSTRVSRRCSLPR